MSKDEKIQMILALTEKAIRINGLTDRKVYKTGDLPTVFITFSGHVSELEITVYPYGWKGGMSSERKSKYLKVDADETRFRKKYEEISLWLDEVER